MDIWGYCDRCRRWFPCKDWFERHAPHPVCCCGAEPMAIENRIRAPRSARPAAAAARPAAAAARPAAAAARPDWVAGIQEADGDEREGMLIGLALSLLIERDQEEAARVLLRAAAEDTELLSRARARLTDGPRAARSRYEGARTLLDRALQMDDTLALS